MKPASPPETWAPELLAIFARHHGLASSPRALQRLCDEASGGSEVTLHSLTRAAERFGFEVQAGRLPSYDALQELDVLPAIVHLRRPVPEKVLALGAEGTFEDIGHAKGFAVVHRATAAQVDLEDPVSGRHVMSRSAFENAWRGIVLCVAPTDDQRRADGGSLGSRASRLLAKVPPPFLPTAGGGLVVAASALLAPYAGARVPLAAIGVALFASIAAVRTTARCAACSRAALAIGLPLAPLGVLFYAALLALLWRSGLGVPTAFAIAFAAGLHVALVGHLATGRVYCLACTVTAIAAWVAAGAVLAGPGGASAAVVVAVTALIASAAIPRLVQVRAERMQRARFESVRALLTRESAPTNERLKLTVYKLEHCPACQIFERDILPPFAQMLGEGLTIERRPATAHYPAPTLLLASAARRVVVVGLPDPEDLREALAAL